jgi:acetoin utilization deacetylase AcuC-like enzyme
LSGEVSGSEHPVKRTGIFFTYFQGERLNDFPGALEGLLDKPNVSYYDAVYGSRDGLFYLEPVAEHLLLKVHSKPMIESVKRTGDYQSALYSAGGTVQAAEEIHRGDIDNAFVFTAFGDHHAGRDFYHGMCYFNGAALAIAMLKEKGIKRFAIIDTDSHHGDGTRDIFRRDASVLHLCFCDQDYSDQYGKIDIKIPRRTSNEEYFAKMKQILIPRVEGFRPEYIFWEYGFDATKGEYGDRGINRDSHIKVAGLIKAAADEICKGRLIAILCGGSGRDTATYTIPRIISVFAELSDTFQLAECCQHITA